MVVMAPKIIEAARRADVQLAGRHTPFIFNCWYVAGFAWDFDRTLRARTILGRPLVLYRTQAGDPIALSDRCIHRSFPLSKSTLDGDTVVCGYHGLRYDSKGLCVEAPALGVGNCPRGVGVRSYPLRAQGTLVWIWMGDEEPADDLPLDEWAESPQWPASQQYYHLPASYVALHENLLDLTHLSFLHGSSFGTPDYASAPYETDIDDARGQFRLVRSVKPTRLPPVWGEPLRLMGQDAARVTESAFLSPAAHVVTAHFYSMAHDAAPPNTRIKTAHLPTPETETTTHYFIHHGRNFAIDDSSITDFMQEQLKVAFMEDVVGLSQVEEMISTTAEEDMFEISLASDRAGVAMRRWLLKKARSQ